MEEQAEHEIVKVIIKIKMNTKNIADKFGKPFTYLLVSESISLFGSQISLIALPAVAIYLLQTSPFAIGIIAMMEWLPILLFGIISGIYVDNHSKFAILQITNIIRFLVYALVPISSYYHILTMETLYVTAFTAGAATVLFDIAFQSHIPEIVKESQISSAFSRLELVRSASIVVGPIIAGSLISIISPAYCIALDAVSFLFAAAITQLSQSGKYTTRGKETHNSEIESEGSFREKFVSGIRIIRSTPALATTIVTMAVANIFTSGISSLLVLYIIQTLHLGTSYLAIYFSIEGVGMLIGSFLQPYIVKHTGEIRLILYSFTTISTGSILLVLAGFINVKAIIVLSIILSAVFSGISQPLLNISLVTYRQKNTPKEFLGRVNATARVTIMSTLPLGALVGGSVAEIVGMKCAFSIATMGEILTVVVLSLLVKSLRKQNP